MSEFALDGLKQVMAIKSRVVLPYLVPKVNPVAWQTPLAGGGCRMPCSGHSALNSGHRLSQSLVQPTRAAFLELTVFIILQLTTPPVNTRVLAFLSSVAGDALTRHLGVILPAVMVALKEKLGTPDEQLVSVVITPVGFLNALLSCPGGAVLSPGDPCDFRRWPIVRL